VLAKRVALHFAVRSLFAFIPATAGCSGALGGSFAPAQAEPGAQTPTDPGNFIGGQVDALACENRTLHPGSMPGLVRLTHRQYDYAVRDLLGVSSNAATEFVADQEFYGFDNNAEKLAVPANQVSRYQVTAEKVAAQLDLTVLARAVPCLAATRDDACRDQLLQRGLALLFRRPLSDAELTRYRTLFAAGNALYEEGDAFTRGVRVVVEAALQSPAFLYRAELRDAPLDGRQLALTDHELAARLALTLWSSLPDAALMAKADAGELGKDDTLEAEVRRMLDDPRSARTLDDFHSQWLEFSRLRFDKDASAFPGYDKAKFEASAKREALTFARNVTLQGGTLAELFSAPMSYVDATLAAVYGVAAPASEFARVDLDPAQRAGLFTQPAFLAGHADALDGSPIHRGAYLQRRVLCREFGALPANVGVLPSRGGDIVTTRDQVEAKTAAPACQACHKDINPAGFAFESFDTLGRFRSTDHGEVVNASGTLMLGAEPASFDGAVQLANELADSDKAKRCYETQWFRYVYGRKEGNDDACHLSTVDREVKDGSLKEMLVALATSRAFRFRAQEDL
jgi:Protein of unknown function (DUF1592)/Protein of unknown function (DUF1588)/Protein of unknown function (DUF1587)/Protein of unknown function (DUF1595)/Protein of unknown function (DUF1585)